MNQSDATKMAGARIMIVDDDVHTLDILHRWLTREGYRTVSADGGAACLELLEQEAQGESDIDVLVLDVMMPGVDGLQVCEHLRERELWRGIPIMLLTAKDDIETRARGMTLGVSEYLTKPINKREFLTRLEAQIHNRSLQRQLARTAAAIESASQK
jgi:DNA-binding response OmpR family regulator